MSINYLHRKKEEFGLFFLIFIGLTIFLTLLGKSSLLISIFESALYTIGLIGIIISVQAIKKISIKNFAGKTFIFLAGSSLILIINTFINSELIKINTNTLFQTNYTLWILQIIFISLAYLFLLKNYSLEFKKYTWIKFVLVFLLLSITTFLVLNSYQLINNFLATIAIFSILITKNKAHKGIVYLFIGFSLLFLSNFIFFYKNTNMMLPFEYMSDIIFIISWVFILLGMNFTKNHYV